MNQRPTFTEGKSFTIVTNHHFVMTEEDLTGGVIDERGDPTIGRGFNKLGILVTVPLDVPLCKSCEGEIVDAVCKDCELLHSDLLPELRAENREKWQ